MRHLVNYKTRTLVRSVLTAALALALVTAAGCGADDASSSPGTLPNGGSGVSQSGAQDFGLFRQILDDGQIPSPETLDPLGFFAEHKLDYALPTCGYDLCIHTLYGVMGNYISGSGSAVIQIGMNTPLTADTMERPPLDLVLALDTSGSMTGEPMQYLQAGLRAMLDHVQEGDTLSLVTYSDYATVLLDHATIAERGEIELVIARLQAAGATNVYDGLFTAFELASARQARGREARVVLLSDGVANSGLPDAVNLVSLARGYASRGIGLTTIGVGAEFDVTLMRSLGEVGAGNFYFLEDPGAVREVFTEEVKTFLVPIAQDVRIDITTDTGYRIRQVYGTNGWRGGMSAGTVSIPSLFLAGRTDSETPVDGGRRGGGGAIMLELGPVVNYAANEGASNVGLVTLTWTDPNTGEVHTQSASIDSPHQPGYVPTQGWFTNATVEKGFVMLNVLQAFQLAAQLAHDSDPGAARGVLEALDASVSRWVSVNPDPDIEDDLVYVRRFIDNLQRLDYQTPVSRPPEPEYYYGCY